MPSPADGDCEDCVQVVKTTKRVRVPCHRNTYKSYTVKVPRQVTEQVERKVNYTDYESRQKQVPYTINRTNRTPLRSHARSPSRWSAKSTTPTTRAARSRSRTPLTARSSACGLRTRTTRFPSRSALPRWFRSPAKFHAPSTLT